MKYLLNNSRNILIGLLIIIFISLVLKFLPLYNLPYFDSTNQLSQIISIEADLLKTWQRSRGLKNTLAYNSEGRSVVLLQRMLQQDDSIYPEKKVTGYYGDSTQTAVIRFQKEYNLSQTGVVDVATRDKLNKIFFSFLCPEQTILYPNFLLKKVNRQFPLPKEYTPASLENISSQVKTIGTTCLRSDVTPYLVKMFKDEERVIKKYFCDIKRTAKWVMSRFMSGVLPVPLDAIRY